MDNIFFLTAIIIVIPIIGVLITISYYIAKYITKKAVEKGIIDYTKFPFIVFSTFSLLLLAISLTLQYLLL
ncbi:MAG: hypothetical protein FWH29_00965 [Methanobrevibacter sp.]|nr:hypothetical protein [Methanobrevibacter sp.]